MLPAIRIQCSDQHTISILSIEKKIKKRPKHLFARCWYKIFSRKFDEFSSLSKIESSGPLSFYCCVKRCAQHWFCWVGYKLPISEEYSSRMKNVFFSNIIDRYTKTGKNCDFLPTFGISQEFWSAGRKSVLRMNTKEQKSATKQKKFDKWNYHRKNQNCFGMCLISVSFFCSYVLYMCVLA